MTKGHHTVTIIPSEITFRVVEGETILGAARRAGVWLPFECGWGSCTTCKVTLVEGEIRELFPEAPAITRRDRRRNRILACQSTALSDIVIKTKPRSVPFPELHTKDYEGTLVGAETLTTGIRRFRFSLDQEAAFLPGQYAILELRKGLRRCYSMSNLPGTHEVEFIAKRYEGPGTRHLFALTQGDTIPIELPYGATYLRETSRNVVFVAGGTGIAPILSLLREVVTTRIPPREADRQVSIFYGAQTPEELVCLDELKALSRRLPRSCLIPVVVDPPAEWKGEVGFVTDAVERCLNDLPEYEYYMAGPPPMIQAALKLLMQKEVPITHVHYDSFG